MICRLASSKLWRVREAVHVNGSSACCWTSRRDCIVISIRSFNLWTRHISSRSRRLLVPWLWNPGIATLDPQASWRVSTTYLRLIRHGTFQQFQNVRICSLVIGNFSWICHESSILIAIISIEELGERLGWFVLFIHKTASLQAESYFPWREGCGEECMIFTHWEKHALPHEQTHHIYSHELLSR